MTMIKILCCLSAAILLLDAVNSDCQYSNVSPEKGVHTMCQYTSDGGNCPDKVPISISDDDQATILDAHNVLRQKIASGGEDGYPAARQMFQLVWNPELATIAQRWADQCTFAHDANRDETSNGQRVQVGQNLGLHNVVEGSGMDYRYGVTRWFDNELQFFPPSAIASYDFSEKNGHLSQVIWGSTKEVGCGISQYTIPPGGKEAPGPVYLFVCDYAPSGNFVKTPVYATTDDQSQIGNLCSSMSKTYPALCAPSTELVTGADAVWGNSNKNNNNNNAADTSDSDDQSDEKRK